jgi:hypothetical protein
VDELDDCYEVAVYHFAPAGLPVTGAFFRNEGKKNPFTASTSEVLAFDPSKGKALFVPWDVVKGSFGEGVVFPKVAEVVGNWNSDVLNLSWETDVGVVGECSLPKSKAGTPSALASQKTTWQDFKDYIGSLRGRKLIFRGQDTPHRLRTSYHRTERANLHRFLRMDIPSLYRHLSARTRHVFQMSIPDEAGAFYNLVQHHGYPTPLLDWTRSPYVAAFFAYQGFSNDDSGRKRTGDSVRVFAFDADQWVKDWAQHLLVIVPNFHISIAEFTAIENERMIPQQGVSMVTNVDDLESYISDRENKLAKKYLWAFDLPARERPNVMRELGYMGITAGSLFPGLDGACKELRERFFGL